MLCRAFDGGTASIYSRVGHLRNGTKWLFVSGMVTVKIIIRITKFITKCDLAPLERSREQAEDSSACSATFARGRRDGESQGEMGRGALCRTLPPLPASRHRDLGH